ncbi:hypothetical protein [Agriterribacter sp.]|uniref:hypothetical protein n=1 Tax=Agriterribacter sp. TaxID=2821509 RepID=UPI002BC77D07|nr:hypothetical protein [Agriterribacter sp.]HRO47415.1 hypothetical protein [Agriterribacter sp.]
MAKPYLPPGTAYAQKNAKALTKGGKIFYAVGTTRLNDFTDFFQLKEKKNLQAAARGYIKTEGAYHATVFTMNEWKPFFQKGIISSLGKVSTKEVVVNKKSRKVFYIDKGAVKVL